MTQPRVLHHDRLAAAGRAPDRWLYYLHGIFGAGRNWRSVARRVVEARPAWGAVLVDLREHGRSRGLAPPHTVAAAAADVAVLAGATALAPAAVLGHSFGGKVALAYAADRPAGLRQVWVVDSTPATGSPAGSAWRMLEHVRALPSRFRSRDELIDALVARAVSGPVAQWMATNLEAGDGEFVWRLDFDAIEALLRDFFSSDLWHAVEDPAPGVAVHFVKADDSDVLTGDAENRIAAAAGMTSSAATAAGAAPTAAAAGVFLHCVAGGHWVNAENPDAMVELLTERLP